MGRRVLVIGPLAPRLIARLVSMDIQPLVVDPVSPLAPGVGAIPPDGVATMVGLTVLLTAQEPSLAAKLRALPFGTILVPFAGQ